MRLASVLWCFLWKSRTAANKTKAKSFVKWKKNKRWSLEVIKTTNLVFSFKENLWFNVVTSKQIRIWWMIFWVYIDRSVISLIDYLITHAKLWHKWIFMRIPLRWLHVYEENVTFHDFLTHDFLRLLQTYTAVYYVIADLVMLAMYLYYKTKNRMAESECFLCISLMPNMNQVCFFCGASYAS